MNTDTHTVKIDGSGRVSGDAACKVAQFYSKTEAVATAKNIGWKAKDATRVEIMGFRVWVLVDDHGGALTREGLFQLRGKR